MPGVQTLDRAIGVLRQLGSAGADGRRLVDLQSATGLTKPTVHRLLVTLMSHGLVEQDEGTRRYRLGREMAILGWSAAGPGDDLRELCQREMQALAEETGDTAFLTVRSGSDSVCIDRKMGPYPIKAFTVDVGTRRPLGVGAGGIALLAWLDPTEREDVLEQLPERLAAFPGVGVRTIRNAVRHASEKGYALSDGMILAGVRGVGMPVLDRSGKAVAAISIAAIASRVSPSRMSSLVATLSRQRDSIQRRLATFARSRRATARP